MDWGKTMRAVGDKHAASIKRAYLHRIDSTKSATDWNVVEQSISQGYIAVYYSINWKPWNPAAQIKPAYDDMYNKSIKYLSQMTIKKAEPGVVIDDRSFTMPNPAAEAWLYEYAGKEITHITSQDLKMIRAVLVEGQVKKWTYTHTARVLMQIIGLNESQYKAWQKYTDSLKVSPSQKAKLSRRYYNRLLRYRAETIALTESHTATNRAWTDAVDKYVRDGIIKPEEYQYYWLTAPDERRCPTCGDRAGETTSVTSRSFPSGDFPPIHPRCRCTAILEKK